MTISAYQRLHDLCGSKGINNLALQHLSLLGLQPCFEDTILLAPIFVAMFFLGIYRMRQCILCGAYNRTWKDMLPPVLKLCCCIVNFVTECIFMSLLKEPARFQLLVYPLGIIGWFSISAMALVELRYFSYMGQWVSRFTFLWIFVCFCIRWPTQKALGRTHERYFYYSCFLACWVSQAILVLMIYFDRYVTLEEFNANSQGYKPTITQEVSDADVEAEKELLVEKVKAATESDKRNHMDDTRRLALKRLYRNAEEEALDMKPVPWTPENNPEGRANVFSRLTVGWLTPLFVFAHKKSIEQVDVWDLRAFFRSIDNFHNFESIWLEQKKIAKKGEHPLRKTLVICFGAYFSTAAPLLAIQNIAQLALPFLLGPLIKFMGNNEPVVNGWMYSIGFFIALMIMTLSENQYFDRTVKTGIAIRASLVPTIYRHALRMSNQARQER